MNSGESAPQHPTLPAPHPLLTCYHTSDCVLVLLYIYAFYLILISPLFFFYRYRAAAVILFTV